MENKIMKGKFYFRNIAENRIELKTEGGLVYIPGEEYAEGGNLQKITLVNNKDKIPYIVTGEENGVIIGSYLKALEKIRQDVQEQFDQGEIVYAKVKKFIYSKEGGVIGARFALGKTHALEGFMYNNAGSPEAIPLDQMVQIGACMEVALFKNKGDCFQLCSYDMKDTLEERKSFKEDSMVASLLRKDQVVLGTIEKPLEINESYKGVVLALADKTKVFCPIFIPKIADMAQIGKEACAKITLVSKPSDENGRGKTRFTGELLNIFA